MRKLLCCVLMMTLLLSACGGQEKADPAEELALTLRGEYLSTPVLSGSASITADYGQRVYCYQLDFSADEEQTVLTLSAPDTVTGITARLNAREDSILEYDGAVLETGPLDDGGLSPLSAIPTMLSQLREGYLDSCALEETQSASLLRLFLRDPQLQPGQGTETTLWLDADSHKLVRGEISCDGFTVIQCDFTSFSMGDP